MTMTIAQTENESKIGIVNPAPVINRAAKNALSSANKPDA